MPTTAKAPAEVDTEALERLARIDESAAELDAARLNLAKLKADLKDQREVVKDLTRSHEKIVRDRPGPMGF